MRRKRKKWLFSRRKKLREEKREVKEIERGPPFFNILKLERKDKRKNS